MTPRNVNRLKLIGIGALALAPVVGSYLLYWFWAPENYTNYGTLLQARAVPVAQLALADGEPFSFEQLRGRWVLVVIDTGSCARTCEEKLWIVRQVRQAQGNERNRVERVWLIDDGRRPGARLAQEYAGTWFVDAGSRSVLERFVAANSSRDHIYLMDPLGNLMMRFPENADPKRMIKDLGRLLKYSSIG